MEISSRPICKRPIQANRMTSQMQTKTKRERFSHLTVDPRPFSRLAPGTSSACDSLSSRRPSPKRAHVHAHAPCAVTEPCLHLVQTPTICLCVFPCSSLAVQKWGNITLQLGHALHSQLARGAHDHNGRQDTWTLLLAVQLMKRSSKI